MNFNYHFLDLSFMHLHILHNYTELQKFNATYEKNLQEGKAADKTMFSLSWDIEELKRISTERRSLRIELSTIIDAISTTDIDTQQFNLPRKLSLIRDRLTTLTKKVVRFKHKPATHMFVIMISSELRNRKPYSLPVQCLPYAGMDEKNMRRILNSLVQEMVNNGMKVAGIMIII